MAISESSQIRVAIEATRFVGRYDRKPLSLVDVSTDYSVNCLEGHHHATSALEVRCDGWVLPTSTWRPCRCVCHEAIPRLPYRKARQRVQESVDKDLATRRAR